jgi:hypothetical protein
MVDLPIEYSDDEIRETVNLLENARDLISIFGEDLTAGSLAAVKQNYQALSLRLMASGSRLPEGRRASALRKLQLLYGAQTQNLRAPFEEQVLVLPYSTDLYVVYNNFFDYSSYGHLVECETNRSPRLDANGNSAQTFVAHVAKTEADNIFLEHEQEILQAFRAVGEAKYWPFVADWLHGWKCPIVAGPNHLNPDSDEREAYVNIFSGYENSYDLMSVKAAYPAGLDLRSTLWIWRRLLFAIGYAHRSGFIHGNLSGHSVRIRPDHSLFLTNWCNAVEADKGHIAFGSARLVNEVGYAYAPPEINEQRPIAAGTDIYAASQLILWLLNPAEMEPRVRAFIFGCTNHNLAARPEDAWGLLGELDSLAEEILGPRKFVPFSMPVQPAILNSGS